MQSRKLNANVGGDLGSATTELMEKNGINTNNSGIPKGAVMLNKELLPSKGKFYASDIYVTPLSAQDLKNLNTMTEANSYNRINGVIASCIHGLPVKDILLNDKMWLLIYIRSVTYDDFPIFIKYECKECGKPGLFKMRLKDLNVKYIKPDFKDTIKLPKSGDEILVRFPSLKYEEKANNLKNNDQLVEALDPEILDLCVYIDSVNGESKTTIEAYNYMLSMNAYDFATFSNYLLENNFGLIPTAEINCDCGNKIIQKYGFTSDFFLPNFNKYKDV